MEAMGCIESAAFASLGWTLAWNVLVLDFVCKTYRISVHRKRSV